MNKKNLIIFDLFCGTKSIARKAEERGHYTLTIDNDKSHEPDICCDILEYSVEGIENNGGIPDMIWASPPCTCFSVMSIGKHWNVDNTPKTKDAEIAVLIVKKTIAIIEYFLKKNSKLIWYMENPCGKLRKLEFMQNFLRKEVTYCQYGEKRRKPTDIWTNDFLWNPKPKCKANSKYHKATCHVAAPRGSHTEGSTQGVKGKVERARVPEMLCEEIIKSVEIRKTLIRTL